MMTGKNLKRLAVTCVPQIIFYGLLTWQAIINVDASEREGKDESRNLAIAWAVIGPFIWFGSHCLIVKLG